MVTITDVLPRSRAAKAGIINGDVLVSINGNEINDVLDYRFYLTETTVRLCLKRGGEEYAVRLTKGEYDDIGLSFETPLMDKKHSCTNKCVFCFIDQLPKGTRETLYFKDDASRLSFLHGNYVTLTNLHDKYIDRIIEMHISPVNVSVHTTNPELRVKMMKNKRAGEVLRYLDEFYKAELNMCGQLVLCHGINDGDELVYSMNELFKYVGPDCDVPAGDIGVGAREIGYFYGQYKKLTGQYCGVLTGKGLAYGGSLARKEATGFGLCYFTRAMLKKHGMSFEGKRVVISGSGNVAIYAAQKATELGGKVVAMNKHIAVISRPINAKRPLAFKHPERNIIVMIDNLRLPGPVQHWHLCFSFSK